MISKEKTSGTRAVKDAKDARATNRRIQMYIMFALYVLLSAFGLIFIKMGINKCLICSVSEGTFNFGIGTMVFIGILMYFASFLISMAVISKMNLAIFYPVSMGLIYVTVCIGGYYLLDEKLSLYQVLGVIMVLGGLCVMNIKSK